MTCINTGNMILCSHTNWKVYRLKCKGTSTKAVYFEWHNYFGPMFWKEKACINELTIYDEQSWVWDELDTWMKANPAIVNKGRDVYDA